MKNVKTFSKLGFCLTGTLIIAGCGKQPAAETAEPAQPAATAETSAQPATAAAAAQVQLQGGNFSFAKLLTVRYDREAVTSKTNRKQHQVFIEAGPGTAEEVLGQVADSIARAGYRKGKVTDDRGGLRQNFRKDGVDRVSVLVRPAGNGPALKTANATVSVYLTETAAAAAP